MINPGKIKAMFLLTAIGDALGIPVKTWPRERIQKEYGLVTKYYDPKDHKWYKGCPAGMWTDDTQLTLAVANSLSRRRRFDMGDIADAHLQAMQESTRGWGKGTIEAVKRYGEGAHWSQSGMPIQEGRGKGNGVVMKMAPLSVFIAHKCNHFMQSGRSKIVSDFTYFTHCSQMALVASEMHLAAVRYILGLSDYNAFNPKKFIEKIMSAAEYAEGYFGRSFVETDLFSERMKYVQYVLEREVSEDELRAMIGSGKCYVYESLPVAFYLVAKNSFGMAAVYEAASYGEDTDSIASIVGALIGLIYGTEIIPRHLNDGLWRRDEVVQVADDFCGAFNIK